MLKQGRIDFPKHPSELANESIRTQPDSISLINKLVEVSEADISYSTAFKRSVFPPVRSEATLNSVLGQIGQVPLASSSTIKELVSKGTEAMPLLIAHLDDKRETKIRVEHRFGLFGGLFFRDEYDYNHRTIQTPPDLDNVRRAISHDITQPTEYRLTVGDLCFVAVGQIVNRNLNIVRYQHTAIINVSSPAHSSKLLSAISNEWNSLTPAKHKASLVQDFLKPDTVERRLQAYLRLAYYYPKACEPLVIGQLHRSRYDVFSIEAFVRGVLYEEKDANTRKHLFESYIAQRGPGARDGIMMRLFDDLTSNYPRRLTDSSQATEPIISPRRLLAELYGFKEIVTKDDRPYVDSVTNSEQADFIRLLAPDQNTVVAAALYSIFITLDDEDDLALACMTRLLGRGFDERLRFYCNRRAPQSPRYGKELREILQKLEKN